MTRKKRRKKPATEGIPLITLIFMMSGFLLGYLLGEILLSFQPHPMHWLGGAAGMALGYAVGQIVYRRHGDVV